MGRPTRLVSACAALILLQIAGPAGASSAPGLAVSAQGKFLLSTTGSAQLESGRSDRREIPSPSGRLVLIAHMRPESERAALAGGFFWDLEIRDSGHAVSSFEGVEANAFFLSDLPERPCLIALSRPETDAIPALLRVYDLHGAILLEERIAPPVDPILSDDGATFAWRTPEALHLLDLRTFERGSLPSCDRFALGPNGQVVAGGEGILLVYDRGQGAGTILLSEGSGPRIRKLTIAPDGSAVFVLLPDRLLRAELPNGPPIPVFNAPPSASLRDLAARGNEILVGLRRLENGRATGELALLDPEGNLLDREEGPSASIPRREAPEKGRGIAWPLAPDSQHPVGNTYGEFQDYGGSPYPHPGIDVMGDPGQPVFAVRRGVVKAILTTSGEWHWRVAVGDSSVAATVPGYLYAHLDEPTIAVNVGDPVEEGQYLGNLVDWPVYDFTHCHFTRIEDSGIVWDGTWLSIHNPHLDLTHQNETEPPFFEPARGSDLLAFCANQTSSYQNPQDLHGAVDIITRVGDRINSDWVCTVQELRYTIYPLGQPGSPLVDDKLSQQFDMVLDTYAGGQIDAFLIDLLYKDDSVCDTRGDYESRQFYHILTNSDGDGIYEPTDAAEAWDTSGLPDGGYVVRVTAWDARGNSSSDSMEVRTVNGNPSSAFDPRNGAEDSSHVLTLRAIAPHPVREQTSIRFELREADRITLSLYKPDGRRLRLLHSGFLAAGSHTVRWDGRDGSGRVAAPGVYLLRLSGEGTETEVGKILVVR